MRSIIRMFGLALIIRIIWTSPCHAQWRSNEYHPTRNYQIQQERIHRDGVLISRPDQENEMIMRLMYNHGIRTVEDYAAWLEDNISYQKDTPPHTWAKAQETLSKRTGDCEDFTLLNISVLQVLGYRPHFIALANPGEAHALCVFKRNGYYEWFNNNALKKSRARDLKNFAREIAEASPYSQILEYDITSRRWTTLYQKT